MTTKYLPNQYSKRELTEKQIALLDALPECNYNPIEAAKKAGYVHPRQGVRAVREEIKDMVTDLIAENALGAANTLSNIMNSQAPIPNIKEKLSAAQTILDRAGFGKKDTIDVNHTVKGGVFVLPEKKIIEGDYEEVPNDR